MVVLLESFRSGILFLTLLSTLVHLNQAYMGRSPSCDSTFSDASSTMRGGTKVMNSTRSMPDLKSRSAWPHFPVYVRAGDGIEILGSKNNDEIHDGDADAKEDGGLPLGVPIEFESPLFVGKILIRLKAIPPTPNDKSDFDSYFEGRKRHYQCIVQGRFKEKGLRLSDVFFGDVYEKPFKGLPSRVIMKGLKKFMERINPGMIYDIASDRPRVLNPIGTVQEMSVDLPGQEPDIVGWNGMKENTNLLGRNGGGGGVDTTNENSSPLFSDSAHRRKQLSKPDVASQYMFDTDKIYTFHIFDHTANIGAYQQDLGLVKIDLTPSLNGQPLALSALTKDERYLFRFEIWHEKILKVAS